MTRRNGKEQIQFEKQSSEGGRAGLRLSRPLDRADTDHLCGLYQPRQCEYSPPGCMERGLRRRGQPGNLPLHHLVDAAAPGALRGADGRCPEPVRRRDAGPASQSPGGRIHAGRVFRRGAGRGAVHCAGHFRARTGDRRPGGDGDAVCLRQPDCDPGAGMGNRPELRDA